MSPPGEAGIPRSSWLRRPYSWAGSRPVWVCRAWSTLARTICLRLKSPVREEGPGYYGNREPSSSHLQQLPVLARRDLMSLSMSCSGMAAALL